MALSGWCGTRGRPQCMWCRSAVCSCQCHEANRQQSKGNQRSVEDVAWDNGPDRKSGPAGALTPVAPGLTDYEGVGC